LLAMIAYLRCMVKHHTQPGRATTDTSLGHPCAVLIGVQLLAVALATDMPVRMRLDTGIERACTTERVAELAADAFGTDSLS
jgi:hypothetical protein